MEDARIDQLSELPLRPEETWQGAVIQMPAWVTGEGPRPFRPCLAMWVAVKAGTVHTDGLRHPARRNLAMAVSALARFARHPQIGGYLPGRVEVRDPALAEHLGGLLGATGVEVAHVDELAALDAVRQDLVRHMSRGQPAPGALEGEGVTIERMRAFAEAGAMFYRARPWQYLTDIDLIAIDQPPGPLGMKLAVVLGAAGRTFGLAFYESAGEHHAITRGAGLKKLAARQRHGLWHLGLSPIHELLGNDSDLWEAHRLELAGPDAYPQVWGLGRDNRLRRPDASQLAFVEGILRAMAATTEAQIDSARWEQQVETIDGPVTFALSLPDLLTPPSAKQWLARGYAIDRRAMERGLAQMHRYVAQHPVRNEDELRALLQRQFVGKSPAQIHVPAQTPPDQAQDLCYQAFDCRGRRSVQLAKEALAICPDCADAYVILAENAGDLGTELELYSQGVAAGERALGPQAFADNVGEFWGILATRPYMRARLGLAHTLERLDRLEEAVEHYRQMLRLNPADNQGVRYMLLPRLLQLRRDAEAARFMKDSGDEPTASWTYTRALLAFRLGGDCPTARRELRKAVRANPHVVACLARDPEDMADPDSYSLGSPEEAICCARELRPAVVVTPGAMAWLQARAPRGGPGPRGDKRRKRPDR